jgi:hypothetical protein
MHVLPDFSGPESDGYLDSQDDDAQEFTGWNSRVTKLDFLVQNQDIDRKLIKLANEQLPLPTLFKKYNITFRQVPPTPSGWLPSVHCPFRDHKEKTPSFGFNPEQNLFHCFGCHRSGQAVQFLAYMEGRSQLEVAKEILGDTSIEEIIEEVDDQNQERITQLLADFGSFVRAFVKRNPGDSKAEEYADSVSWSLDVYLRKHSLVGSIDLRCLEAIINKIKQQLELFGDPE